MDDEKNFKDVCPAGDVELEPQNQLSVKYDRQNKTKSGLLGCVSGLCAFLCILCSCLIALVVILHRRIDSINELRDLDRPRSLFEMSATELKSDPAFRLPREVQPLHYNLYLHPDLENGTYQGKVTIQIKVLDTRSNVMLHQKDLTITKASMMTYGRENNYEIPIKETYNIEGLEEFVVRFHDDIHSGKYQLTFEFSGALQPDKIVGFYSSKYKDQGTIRSLATSKFEPTYARRAFPCFDEPAFKAKFSVKLVHPTGDCYGALSSMNVESTLVDRPEKGLTTVIFAESVPMSTYLMCFIVSDFVALSAKAKKLDENLPSLPISVYTTRSQKERAVFALDIGVKIIEYYTQLFRIDYPLPKLDMAAIPDFVSGAMENWGLITYREARLLYDERTSSTADKEGVVQVIAHEFAHMWFGNLVTMAWWNDLWLNEGFASYMQYKSADAILPDWGLMDRFLTETLHPVFVTDAKLSSHPIVQTVNNPDDITSIFDVITYSKGASILRMLENFIGPEIFITGITTYLNKFKYSNAETADLFAILQEAAGGTVNVTAIMDTWTRQMGFPVVNVKLRENGQTLELSQKRFLLDSTAKFDASTSDYGYKWTIPITYITDKNSAPELSWFDKDTETLEITLKKPAKWVKLNHNQVGYYRVNYDAEGWNHLLEQLKENHKRIESESDRASLLEDALSLAQAGQLDYSTAMNMTMYLNDERSSAVWKVAATKLLSIDNLLSSTDLLPKFRRYVRNLVEIPYHDVTWRVDNIETHAMLSLRGSILNLACAVGHVECLDEVGALFKSWLADPLDERPHPDVRSYVYKYGMSHVGKEAEWDAMFKKFVNETNAVEKLKLMHSLAAVQSSFLLSKYINIAIDETYVRSQDTFGCLLAIARNPIGNPLVWDWVRENWEFLVKRYTLNDRYLGQLVPGITQNFATQAKLEEIKAFFEKYPEAGAGKAYRIRALETVSNNIKWVGNYSARLGSWLDSVNSRIFV